MPYCCNEITKTEHLIECLNIDTFKEYLSFFIRNSQRIKSKLNCLKCAERHGYEKAFFRNNEQQVSPTFY